jgi:hypothetical protein
VLTHIFSGTKGYLFFVSFREALKLQKNRYERLFIKLWIGGDPLNDVLKACDVDKDGAITYADMINGVDVCLPLKDGSGKNTGALCKLKKYVCDRASVILGHHVYK